MTKNFVKAVILFLFFLITIIFILGIIKKDKKKISKQSNLQNYQKTENIVDYKNKNNYYLGLTPSKDLNKMYQNIIKMKEIFNQKFSINIIPIIGTSYIDIINGFKQNEIDMSFLPPVAFVKGELDKITIPILKINRLGGDYSDKYFAAIITNANNTNISSLKDVCGKKIGYTDLDSSAGYIYPKYTLYKFISEHKILNCNLTNEFFLGSYKPALEALIKKEIDVISVFGDSFINKSGAWNKLGNYNIKILDFSIPIPNENLIINKNIINIAKIKKLFIAFSNDSEGKEILQNIFDTTSITEANAADYLNVKKVITYVENIGKIK